MTYVQPGEVYVPLSVILHCLSDVNVGGFTTQLWMVPLGSVSTNGGAEGGGGGAEGGDGGVDGGDGEDLLWWSSAPPPSRIAARAE